MSIGKLLKKHLRINTGKCGRRPHFFLNINNALRNKSVRDTMIPPETNAFAEMPKEIFVALLPALIYFRSTCNSFCKRGITASH